MSFEFVLIATELFLLSGFFYYVFIREPKPFELKENLWGIYDPRLSVYTKNGANQPVHQHVEADNELDYAAYNEYSDYESLYSYSQADSVNQHRCCNHATAKHAARAAHKPDRPLQQRNTLKLNGVVYVAKKQSGLGAIISGIGDSLSQIGSKL